MDNSAILRVMDEGGPSPLEALAASLEAHAKDGPKRYAAAFNESIQTRELIVRVLEDLDRRLRLVEERLEER